MTKMIIAVAVLVSPPIFMGPKELFARMNEPVLDEVSAMEGCTIFSFSHYLPRQAGLGDSCGSCWKHILLQEGMERVLHQCYGVYQVGEVEHGD